MYGWGFRSNDLLIKSGDSFHRSNVAIVNYGSLLCKQLEKYKDRDGEMQHDEKKLVVLETFREWRNQKQRGRFLAKEDNKSSVDGVTTRSSWNEVDDEGARKVTMAFLSRRGFDREWVRVATFVRIGASQQESRVPLIKSSLKREKSEIFNRTGQDINVVVAIDKVMILIRKNLEIDVSVPHEAPESQHAVIKANTSKVFHPSRQNYYYLTIFTKDATDGRYKFHEVNRLVRHRQNWEFVDVDLTKNVEPLHPSDDNHRTANSCVLS